MKTRLVNVQNVTNIDTEVFLTTVSSIGVQGPPGPPGPPSVIAERILITRIASGNIGGQRMVISNVDGTVSFADSSNLLHLGKVVGLTDFAALDGEEVTITREGLVEFEGFSFDPDLPVYLSTDGLLTQTPAVTGFSQIVGFAESPTKLFVYLREPILL